MNYSHTNTPTAAVLCAVTPTLSLACFSAYAKTLTLMAERKRLDLAGQRRYHSTTDARMRAESTGDAACPMMVIHGNDGLCGR